MDIFDFALKMETDGEKYYRELAGKVIFDDLKKVLEDLAADEQRHYEIVRSMQQQSPHNVEVDPSLGRIANVFAVNQVKGFAPENKADYIAKLKDEQLDVYRAAMGKENESVELYRKLKDTVKSQQEKVICEKLIHEEGKHAEVLGNIIDMLNHVHDWVEAAEFNHQDKY